MSVMTIEGVVRGGHIHLSDSLILPDETKVFVVVPGVLVERVARIYSPRLADPEQVADFVMEVIEAQEDGDDL